MSPTSYRTAPPRVEDLSWYLARWRLRNRGRVGGPEGPPHRSDQGLPILSGFRRGAFFARVPLPYRAIALGSTADRVGSPGLVCGPPEDFCDSGRLSFLKGASSFSPITGLSLMVIQAT